MPLIWGRKASIVVRRVGRGACVHCKLTWGSKLRKKGKTESGLIIRGNLSRGRLIEESLLGRPVTKGGVEGKKKQGTRGSMPTLTTRVLGRR